MKLEVTFHGLFLFARVPGANPATFYVLLPKTPRPTVPKHEVTILFDAGRTTLNAGEELRFTNLPNAGAPAGFPKGIANLKSAHGKFVGLDNVGNSPRLELRARAILRDGKFRVGQRACWKVGGNDEEMAVTVVWDVNAPTENELRWEVVDFDGNLVRTLPIIPAPHGTVAIQISHMDSDSTGGPRPPNGFEPPHFEAYHALLDDGGGLKLPSLQNCAAGPGPISGEVDERHIHVHPHAPHDVSATLYSCMVAGGEVGP